MRLVDRLAFAGTAQLRHQAPDTICCWRLGFECVNLRQVVEVSANSSVSGICYGLDVMSVGLVSSGLAWSARHVSLYAYILIHF